MTMNSVHKIFCLINKLNCVECITADVPVPRNSPECRLMRISYVSSRTARVTGGQRRKSPYHVVRWTWLGFHSTNSAATWLTSPGDIRAPRWTLLPWTRSSRSTTSLATSGISSVSLHL